MPPAEAGAEDPQLRDLRERLEATGEAARRLAAEAAASARTATSGVPPGGWAAREEGPRDDGSAELAALLRAFDGLRATIPPDLAEQLVAVVRELLLALRALVDYALSRLEQRRAAESTVEDIPIA
jgi:hypothetical protein